MMGYDAAYRFAVVCVCFVLVLCVYELYVVCLCEQVLAFSDGAKAFFSPASGVKDVHFGDTIGQRQVCFFKVERHKLTIIGIQLNGGHKFMYTSRCVYTHMCIHSCSHVL